MVCEREVEKEVAKIRLEKGNQQQQKNQNRMEEEKDEVLTVIVDDTKVGFKEWMVLHLVTDSELGE